MKSLEEFQKQIDELHAQHDALESATTISEAKDNIIQLQEIEKKLFFIEQQIAKSITTILNSHTQEKRSLFSSIFNRAKKQNELEDISFNEKKVELYKHELTSANAIRSILGQVTVPKLKEFVIKNKSSTSVNYPNYYDYIKSNEWRIKAEGAKARAGNCCQVCNRSRAEVQLDAHHRTYERLGNELPEDITVLCRDCHHLYEDKKREESKIKVCEICGIVFSTEKSFHKLCSSCYSESKQAENINTPKLGFCIRCKSEIPLNPKAPYCYECYKIWKKFENPNYQENICHLCGKSFETSMSKPACLKCFLQFREIVDFR